jgi:ABC-type nitrate/sulfonate/bicarbonate transport system permease component
MNATDYQILKLVRLPFSLPAFFSGMKIAATYSVSGAIVGEYVGAKEGLGIYMNIAASSHAFPLVFAVIFVVIVLSLTLFAIISVIERLAIPWHFYQSK